MNAPHNSAQARAWRKRTAAVFAAVGALIFSSGIVMLTAPAASAAPGDKVGVCHRKASGSYKFLTVSASSTGEPHGHITHLEGYSGGVDGLPDYVLGSTSVPVEVDTDAELKDWCLAKNGGVDPQGTTVDLADLDITLIDGCATTGSIIEPTSQDLEYTISGGSWTNLTGDVTVTAELLDIADSFTKPYPGEWKVAGNKATWTIPFGEPTVCPVYGTLADPDITENGACAAPGSVEPMADSDNVHYVLDGGNDWSATTGDHVITAVLINGATAFANPTPSGWSLSDDKLTATHPVRLGSATAPCGDDGDSDGDGDGNGSGGDNGNGGGNGNGGNTDQPGGGNGGNPNPGTPPVVIPNPELISVTPNYAEATEATCSQRGALIVPNQPAGVLMSRTGSVPGTVTFTYAPATGYTFPAGTVTKQSVKVEKKLEGDACILGDEEVKPTHTSKPTHQAKPKPRDRGPVVLGTQAAVPTAVDAGLGSLPTSVVSSTGSPRLAQALVAGGLLMLVAGGSMGLGRRPRGAHES
ncbi:MAG: hypothetical protein ACTHKG_14025 [Nocardioides sp.]